MKQKQTPSCRSRSRAHSKRNGRHGSRSSSSQDAHIPCSSSNRRNRTMTGRKHSSRPKPRRVATIGGRKSSQRGGSIASNNVQQLMNSSCASTAPYLEQPSSPSPFQMGNEFMSRNYAATYKTTGGRKKQRHSRRQRRQRGGYDSSAPAFSTNSNYPNTQLGALYDDYFKYRGQTGDSNILTGSQVPPTWYQNFLSWYDGKSTVFVPSYNDSLNYPTLQTQCSGTSCAPMNITVQDPQSAVGTMGALTNNDQPVNYQLYQNVDTSYVPPSKVLPPMQRA